MIALFICVFADLLTYLLTLVLLACFRLCSKT